MEAIMRNLRDEILVPPEKRDGRFMVCSICGGEYSASSGDYFFIIDPDYQFKCCGKTVEIVRRSCTLHPVH